MPRFLVLCRILTLFCVCGGFPEYVASQSAATTPAASDAHYERDVLRYLWPTLQSAGKAGRIYYEAVCPPNELYPLAFPRLLVQPPSKDKADLAAVRSMFVKENGVSVAEDRLGIVRIKIGVVSDEILDTRIDTLHLTPQAQYNYPLAIGAIERSAEVQAAMKQLKVSVPARLINILLVPTREDLPHLPPEISNLTVDQALDMIANTWKGIVLFGACTRPATYEISFADGIFIAGTKY